MRRQLIFLGLIAAGLWTARPSFQALAAPEGPQKSSLTIRNEDQGVPAVVISAEIWEKLPRTTVKVTGQQGETSYEGVVMAELLRLVKAPLGAELRGKMLTRYVLVEAADDYRVVFALPEVDPESTSQIVLVADRRDGKLLDAKEGPYRVVVPAEEKHARWVRQVTRISIEAAKDSGR